MSGPWEGEGSDEPIDDPRHAVAESDRERFEPPERSGLGRGVVLIVLALVLGALLMPSATRAPLAVLTSRSSSGSGGSHSSSTTTTLPRSTTTTAPTVVPSSVHVLVANATSVNGVAGAVTSFLGGKGFPTLAAVNATTKLTTSQIYFTSAGSDAAAVEVAAALGLTSTAVRPGGSPPPVSTDAGAWVVVIAGQDLASRFGSSTTTTARG